MGKVGSTICNIAITWCTSNAYGHNYSILVPVYQLFAKHQVAVISLLVYRVGIVKAAAERMLNCNYRKEQRNDSANQFLVQCAVCSGVTYGT